MFGSTASQRQHLLCSPAPRIRSPCWLGPLLPALPEQRLLVKRLGSTCPGCNHSSGSLLMSLLRPLQSLSSGPEIVGISVWPAVIHQQPSVASDPPFATGPLHLVSPACVPGAEAVCCFTEERRELWSPGIWRESCCCYEKYVAASRYRADLTRGRGLPKNLRVPDNIPVLRCDLTVLARSECEPSG